MTRREALKRGAVVAGTAVWVAPAVQVLGMSPASAQVPSGQPGGQVKGSSASSTGLENGVGHGIRPRPTAPQLPSSAQNPRP